MRPAGRTKGMARVLLLGWVALLTAAPMGPGAEAAGPFRVGIVLPGDQWASGVEGLKEGMRALGYVEGKDLQYLFENARGDQRRVAEVTRRFVAEKADVIFTITNTALKVVADATRPSRTPVVFGSASGPVESGIAPAYADPATHVTGVTSGSIELVAKRLEILREILPQVRRVVAIGDLEADSSRAAFALAQETAAKLGLTLVEHRVRSRDEAIQAARRTARGAADALFLIPGLHSVGAAPGIAQAARAARLPFAVYQVEHVRRGGALLSYGSSYYLQGRQSAALVDRILRGTRPANLPIERPARHELILNLETARAIGIAFSPEALNRADEVVGQRAER